MSIQKFQYQSIVRSFLDRKNSKVFYYPMMIRLIKLFVSSLVYCCDRFGTAIMTATGKSIKGTCVVLYYHGVQTEERNAFRRQMEILVKKTTPISIETSSRFENNKNYSAITFDDGFANVFENALPILKELRIPAVIFIPTAFIGGFPKWIQNKDSKMHSCPLADLDLIDKWKNEFTIGSHTVSHPDLTSISNRRANSELTHSKAYLEKLMGKTVKFLSFPHGRYNNTLISFAEQAGYSKIFTIKPDYCVADFDYKLIGRVMVTPSDWKIEYTLSISGAYRWMRHASEVKTKILKTFQRFEKV